MTREIAMSPQPSWDLGDFTRIPVEELEKVFSLEPRLEDGHNRKAVTYKAPTRHATYPYLLTIKDGDAFTGNYPFVYEQSAKDAATLWFSEGKKPEQLTLKSVMARKARDRAEREAELAVQESRAPKEQPAPANASFFWELRGIADPTCFHFASKHLAIESLEVTYADAVAEQEFDIQWGHQNMSAVIGIKGIGCYTLTLKLAQTIFTTPIHLQRHKDL
jgi:ATPase subunit of ABC transporter with duplicated ATPase domains